jgi:aryl-alcohol dehydrogenase
MYRRLEPYATTGVLGHEAPELSKRIAALGIRGTCAIVGGAKPTATVNFNHPDVLLQGKRIIGAMGSGGQTPMLLQSLMELQVAGRFSLEKLIRFYDFAE